MTYNWFNMAADGLLIFPYFPEKRTAYFIATIIFLGFQCLLLFLVFVSPFLRHCAAVRQTVLQLAFYVSALLSSVLFLPIIGTTNSSHKC